jgi:hypothetical protein
MQKITKKSEYYFSAPTRRHLPRQQAHGRWKKNGYSCQTAIFLVHHTPG